MGFVPAKGSRTGVPAELVKGENGGPVRHTHQRPLAGPTALFVDVEIQAGTAAARTSRASLDRFTHAFDQVMRETERRYTVSELIEHNQLVVSSKSSSGG